MAPGLIDFTNEFRQQVAPHTTSEADLEHVLEIDASMLRRVVRETRERYDLFELSNSEVMRSANAADEHLCGYWGCRSQSETQTM